MKTKDKKAMHSKSQQELRALLAEKRRALIKTKMEKAINKVKDVHLGAKIRHEIAVIATILRQKEQTNV